METNPPPGHVVGFGPFEVDLRTGELRKRGIRLALQEQPLRILAALLEQPGQVVTRETLCRRLWPQGTFVDFEHSLNAAVRRLRVTLNDVADTPRFIETVHRRGYRFLSWQSPLLSAALSRRSSLGSGERRRMRLAVLPFVFFTGEGRQDGFSEGLTEETVTQLARLCPPQVGVMARTGRVSGADYLLEGSIRRHGDRVRIIAQLIDAHEDTHLWAATYDRVLGDALALETDVAEAMAREVTGALVHALQPPHAQDVAS